MSAAQLLPRALFAEVVYSAVQTRASSQRQPHAVEGCTQNIFISAARLLQGAARAEMVNPLTLERCADTGIKAAASQVQSFLTHGANSSFGPNTTFALQPPHQNGTIESKAIGSLVASSVQLGADLAASGHAVSLAADERVSGNFERGCSSAQCISACKSR